MRPIIQRTELSQTRHDQLLVMGQALILRFDHDKGHLQVWADVKQRSLLWARHRQVQIGQLDAEQAALICDGVRKGNAYRVRIVELIPPHLRKRGSSGVIVSVWGEETTITHPDPDIG